MISDERLAEMEARAMRRPASASAERDKRQIIDLLAALRAERERVAALEELVQTLGEEAAEAYRQVDDLAALTSDPEQA